MSETISALLADIRGLQDTILYCENRILRKQIAIEEILQNRSIEREFLQEPQKPQEPLESKDGKNYEVETDFISGRKVLSLFNGQPLSTKQVREMLHIKDCDLEKSRQLNAKLTYLKNTRRLVKVKHGVYEKMVSL